MSGAGAGGTGGRHILTDWNDLRFFLSVARLGSLSASSRFLKVDPATVGRRISSLEAAMGLRFFERRSDGYRLTDTGLKLLDHATRVEEDLHGLTRALESEDRSISGPVAITSSEAVTLPFLIPALPSLRARYPGIRVDFVSSNEVLSLARREADIAVRMVRPEEGDLLARKIGTMGFGLYASRDYIDRAGMPSALGDLQNHALVDWLGDYPRAETTVWYREAAASAPVVRMTGPQERMQAALAGVGIVCLPHIMARDTRLLRVLAGHNVPSMELWLLVHPDTARVKRVRAVMDFIIAAAKTAASDLQGPEPGAFLPSQADAFKQDGDVSYAA